MSLCRPRVFRSREGQRDRLNRAGRRRRRPTKVFSFFLPPPPPLRTTVCDVNSGGRDLYDWKLCPFPGGREETLRSDSKKKKKKKKSTTTPRRDKNTRTSSEEEEEEKKRWISRRTRTAKASGCPSTRGRVRE